MRGSNVDSATLHPFRDAMLDGILDHRLQDEARNLRRLEVRRNIQRESEPVAESCLLNIEILLRKIEFLGQRNLLAIGVVHHPTKDLAYTNNHSYRRFVALLTHEACDRVQSVEQEVRLNLAA